jgi:hypothetical protein
MPLGARLERFTSSCVVVGLFLRQYEGDGKRVSEQSTAA